MMTSPLGMVVLDTEDLVMVLDMVMDGILIIWVIGILMDILMAWVEYMAEASMLEIMTKEFLCKIELV